jgi:hypothetical protein
MADSHELEWPLLARGAWFGGRFGGGMDPVLVCPRCHEAKLQIDRIAVTNEKGRVFIKQDCAIQVPDPDPIGWPGHSLALTCSCGRCSGKGELVISSDCHVYWRTPLTGWDRNQAESSVRARIGASQP